jgi:Flp pilus assembly protein TadB
VIKGQIKYYDESAALSAISVELIADEAVQPIEIGGWQPQGVLKNAVEALIRSLQFLANAIIWIVIYVLPVLAFLFVIFVLPPLLLIRFWMRRKKQKAAQKGPPNPPAAAPPA